MRKIPALFWLKLIVIAIFSSITVFSSGQSGVAFSGDSTKFPGELNRIFFNLADNEKKIITPYMESFIQLWNQERFNAPKKKIIYSITNEMVKRKIRVYPDFFNYINALNIFVNTKQPDEYFIPWSEILVKLLSEKNARRYHAFIEFSIAFYSEGVLYQSSSTQWKIKAPSFRFSFDTVPQVIFPVSALVCKANEDSLAIASTKGVYYPLTSFWKGEGGRVNWVRAGADPDKIFADLADYDIQMRFSKFQADSVSFTHQKYFPRPILGKYTDKVVADMTEEKASYPRFASYDKMIGIKNLFDNVDFLGGFAIEGTRIIGSGDRTTDARLFFKKDGKDFVIAGSDVFVIRPGKISSGMASITIYHESDSIFHPGLQLKYLDEQKELAFTKDERITKISPWFDSFHQIEIYCEALYWKVGEPKVSFQMMKGPSMEGKAVFESSSYYSLPRYEKIQGIDEFNPLNRIKAFTQKRNSLEFTLDEYTKYLNLPSEQVENQLLNLATRGFLVYDFEDKRAIVKTKLYDYVNAFHGKSDYDGIFFNSFVSGSANGLLNLETFDLTVSGVKMVVVSDSQQVKVYPSNMEIVLKKNRDFTFSGRIEAGLFDYYATDCSFEYGNFRVNLPAIDSMLFYTIGKTRDPKTGDFPLVKIKTPITNLSGSLLIDDPGNKSGLKNFPEYPVFTNKNNAFVYWNKKTIQNGVYQKENFFYEVDPFTIKRLDDLDTDTLRFTGTLTSAGVLPKLTEPLKVRPDNSLGIEKQTDPEGLPVYGGKGTLIAKIDLSNKGLRAGGVIKCLNAESVSPDFLLLPDSMKTLARSFDIAERSSPVELPKVHADSVLQFWMPYKDSLVVQSQVRPMAMYSDQSGFEGKLALTPSLLSGDGTVRIKDAEMDSRGFKFQRRTFDALIANFRIKSYDLADLTISTKNYQTHFDFDMRRGEFKSNVGISKVEFPINKYSCSMDRFDWLIDSEEIQLSNERSQSTRADTLSLAQLIDLDYTGSEFVSMHPHQDSLKFFAAQARYHLRTNIINAEEVRIIKVADAAVYPDSGKVTIQKDAKMNVLNHAIVIANTTTKNHQFYNASISISSRQNYTGLADFDYRDKNGQLQKISFDKIWVDSSQQTIATGTITDSAGFLLSPEFAFKGAVAMKAAKENLYFNGGFHPVTTCFTEKPQWVRFESLIDPNHVMIPVRFPLRNTDREPINLGVMFFNSEARISSSFFRPRISFSDTIISSAEGFIEYNTPTNEFRIASEDKLKDISSFGPYLSMNTWNCKLRGEGKLNLSLNSGALKLESFGMIDYYIIPDSTQIKCALTLNFPFSEPALQRFTDQLNAVNLPGVKLKETPYSMALNYLLPKEDSEKLKNELELLGKYKKFPDELERTLFLSDVTFKWDSNTTSYISKGNIGIASVGKNQVNRYVTGIIEFKKKRGNDEFAIYLELAKDQWYFFTYRNNHLMALASDINFNDIVREAVTSRTEIKRIQNLVKDYTYSVQTERARRDFLRKFETEESE